VNRPPGAQVLLLALPDEVEKEAAAVMALRVSGQPHSGQAGVRSACEKRTICSNEAPQAGQWYSYKGIFQYSFSIYKVLYPSIA